jgi:hypothetical protein
MHLDGHDERDFLQLLVFGVSIGTMSGYNLYLVSLLYGGVISVYRKFKWSPVP